MCEEGRVSYPLFVKLCKHSGIPQPEPEFRFHPKRKWRMDYAFVPQKVCVEVEGGVYTQGRHTRGSGFMKDMEKYNEASAMGWRIIRVTPSQLCTMETIDLIKRALNREDAA